MIDVAVLLRMWLCNSPVACALAVAGDYVEIDPKAELLLFLTRQEKQRQGPTLLVPRQNAEPGSVSRLCTKPRESGRGTGLLHLEFANQHGHGEREKGWREPLGKPAGEG